MEKYKDELRGDFEEAKQAEKRDVEELKELRGKSHLIHERQNKTTLFIE